MTVRYIIFEIIEDEHPRTVTHSHANIDELYACFGLMLVLPLKYDGNY
jgi:hypothetical protein